MLELVLEELDIDMVPFVEALPVLDAAALDEELSAAARTAGAAVRKTWPPKVVVPPVVPVARVIAEPPIEETITTGAEFASAGGNEDEIQCQNAGERAAGKGEAGGEGGGKGEKNPPLTRDERGQVRRGADGLLRVHDAQSRCNARRDAKVACQEIGARFWGTLMSSPWMSLSVADPTYDAMPSEWASTQWTASLRVTVPVGNPSWVGIGSVTGEQN